jgi:hypothetical protein
MHLSSSVKSVVFCWAAATTAMIAAASRAAESPRSESAMPRPDLAMLLTLAASTLAVWAQRRTSVIKARLSSLG